MLRSISDSGLNGCGVMCGRTLRSPSRLGQRHEELMPDFPLMLCVVNPTESDETRFGARPFRLGLTPTEMNYDTHGCTIRDKQVA